MKTPARLAPALLPLALAIVLTGCSPKETPHSAGSSVREQELIKEVSDLRAKLASSERELQQARSANHTPAPVATPAPDTERSAERPADGRNEKAEDTSYIVVKKTFTAGKLIPVPTGANPNATERQAADCRVTFKGEQSGKEYPEIEVQEIAYASFREGGSYTAQEVAAAKKVAAIPAPARPTAAEQARALFGN